LPEGQYPDTKSPIADDIMSDLDPIILLDKNEREETAQFVFSGEKYSHEKTIENLFFTTENNKIISIFSFMHN